MSPRERRTLMLVVGLWLLAATAIITYEFWPGIAWWTADERAQRARAQFMLGCLSHQEVAECQAAWEWTLLRKGEK